MIGDDLDFEITFAVHESWNRIKQIPNYAEVAGEILFRKIFSLAPVALNMYSFGPQFVGKEETLYQSDKFKVHAKGVVSMLDQAVNMLGPDLEPVLIALSQLGGRHIEYGVLPAHYGIVGEALLYTLQTALGEHWTPRVKDGWIHVYGLVSTAMMAGAETRLERKRRRNERRRGAKPCLEGSEKLLPSKVEGKSSLPSSLVERRKARGSNNTASSLRLADITGISGLNKTTPDNSKQERVHRLLEDALSVSTYTSVTSNDDSSCDPAEPGLDEFSYAQIVEAVYTSWDVIRGIPNYQEVAGVLLFRKIFEIAPVAKGLFHFTTKYGEDDESMYSDPDFLTHARRVVAMLDVAVNMLGPDLGPVTHALHELGSKHVAYGVIPDHYPIVGQALLLTLETALGEEWTPRVKSGWTAIYDFVSATMISGAKYDTRRRSTGKS